MKWLLQKRRQRLLDVSTRDEVAPGGVALVKKLCFGVDLLFGRNTYISDDYSVGDRHSDVGMA